jgi:hypothetical protein
MGSLDHREIFGPLDLEIIDRVYDVASAHIEARNLYYEVPKIAEQADNLRKMVFACAASGHLDFDGLCDRVLARLAEIAPDRRAA